MSFRDVARIASGQLRLVSPPRRRIATTEGFYIPPEDLGEGKPGDVIRAEPMDAYLVPGVRFRARAWRMLYRSTSAVGEPTAVSPNARVFEDPSVQFCKPYDACKVNRPVLGILTLGTYWTTSSRAATSTSSCRRKRNNWWCRSCPDNPALPRAGRKGTGRLSGSR